MPNALGVRSICALMSPFLTVPVDTLPTYKDVRRVCKKAQSLEKD